MVDHAMIEQTRQIIIKTQEAIKTRQFWKAPKKTIKADLESILTNQLKLLNWIDEEAARMKRTGDPTDDSEREGVGGMGRGGSGDDGRARLAP